MYINRCLWCEKELTPQKHGRPKLFCSEACRHRWRRWRETLPAPDSGAAFLDEIFHVPRDPDEAAVWELLALRGSVLVLRRVARRVRPAMATRLVDIAAVIEAALRRHFGDVIDGSLREALNGRPNGKGASHDR